MAIGDSQDGGRAYGDVKHELPLLQLPRTNSANGFYGGLPLAPAESRQNQYLDTRPEIQHQFQPTIATPVDAMPTAYNGMSFPESQERMHTPMRRPSRVSVTMTIHGLEDPSTADLEWSLSTGITQDQRARITRYVRKVLIDVNGTDTRYNTPKREESCGGSRRSSWTPDVQGSAYRWVPQQGTRRRAEQQLSRQSTPDEDDDDYIPLEMSQMQLIRLSDAEAVAQYYEDVFKGIQQLALKLILKEWIKVIEPKKQKNFPYKKEIRPTWWPDAAAYKEPDHIKLDDRIHLALAIIRHAQNPATLNGEGLHKLEMTAGKHDLVFENDSPAKAKFRKRLLESLFALARAEQQVKNEERDCTEGVSLPMVKKFEKPNKKRKKNPTKKQSMNSDASGAELMSGYEGDKSPGGLLRPGTLKSQGERAISAPNTPAWSRHATQDSGICFQAPGEQTSTSHLLPYAQSFDHAPALDTRYSSYNEGNMDDPNSSPGSGYHSSTSPDGNLHMMYPQSSQPLGYSTAMSGLSAMPGHGQNMMSSMVLSSQGRPQTTTVYNAMTETEDRSWSATPASYMTTQPPSFTTPTYY